MASLIYWKLNSQMAQILFKKCEWRSNINDILKAFDDFEKKQKSVWINVFWYIEVFIFWNCIQYTIYWSKTQMLKKISFGWIIQYKNCPFFSFVSSNSLQFCFSLAIFIWAETQGLRLYNCVVSAWVRAPQKLICWQFF